MLPAGSLLRRADTAAVIGAALVARAGGAGHRRIAAVLGRPVETVRGWLRRFADRVETVRRLFTVLLRAVAARFAVFTVPVWGRAAAVSGGRLLAPGWLV